VVRRIDDDGARRFPSVVDYFLAEEPWIDPSVLAVHGFVVRLAIVVTAIVILFRWRPEPLLRPLPVLLVRIAKQEFDEAPAKVALHRRLRLGHHHRRILDRLGRR
jgi:hypothetical protein